MSVCLVDIWNTICISRNVTIFYSARNVVGVVGESVNLSFSKLYPGPYSEISWFYNETQKILLWEREEQTKIFETNLKPRICLAGDNITLHIQQLRKEDSSTYKLQTSLLSTRQVLSEHIRLDVYERLTKPQIALSPSSSDNGTCLFNATCSVEQVRENVTYNWIPLGQRINASIEGPILSVRWKPGDQDQYTCIARNPVSNSSYTIFASKLCADKTSRISLKLLVVILPSIFNLLFILN
ncbi:SLAM family member 9-like isoform 2-T2 [Sarcophilus harrisii]